MEFRDYIARKEDESITFVLSNRAVFNIMEHRPKQVAELRTKIKNLSVIGKKYSQEIVDIVKGCHKLFMDLEMINEVVKEEKNKQKEVEKKIIVEKELNTRKDHIKVNY